MKKFERYVERIQQQKIHELKIAEDFREFRGENVGDSEISVDDTETLIYNYIQDVDTDLDKDRIKGLVSELMVEAQSVEIAWLNSRNYVGRTFFRRVITLMRSTS